MSLIFELCFYHYCNVVYFIYERNYPVEEVLLGKDSIYNLLTVNTIFTGFLYSMLGNMVAFSAREDIQELDAAGYIDSCFSPMYFGLFFFARSTLKMRKKIWFFFIDKVSNLCRWCRNDTTTVNIDKIISKKSYP